VFARSNISHNNVTMKVLLALSSLIAVTNAIELTLDNWDAETEGKSVFIKFLAPW